ncbi:calcium/sodium antiporter [Hyphobacterium sp. HN65]|uniref:Calcium/sodium antiporter n=1 Tax=Hyphobacterium lacteum TaxID=3116575 RepID=A0ABU7LSP9_9PROT|nr:calcium/sodium antiporter [Hyphobacterium sp. HN65]MEE2526364.1 calcium/sodium antiporter [Hyphobacterium sp. HN65]
MISGLMIFGGLALLAFGGDGLVRGSVGIANRLKLSPMFVGLVLVGFGTSAPELATSVQAQLSGSPDVAVGNVVGSNTANILLILGIGALIRPILAVREALLRDGLALSLVTVAAITFLFHSPLPAIWGAALIGLLLGYIGLSYVLDRRRGDRAGALHEAEAASASAPENIGLAILFFAGGLVGVLVGARLLVTGAIDIAGAMGVPEAIIGLTLVAIGTSLPELAATIAAALRRQGDVAFGNVIGSNIFNAAGILGAAALVRPLEIPGRILGEDIWIMLAATAILILFAFTGQRVDRREGALLLALYAGYIIWLSASA